MAPGGVNKKYSLRCPRRNIRCTPRHSKQQATPSTASDRQERRREREGEEEGATTAARAYGHEEREDSTIFRSGVCGGVFAFGWPVKERSIRI